MNRGRALNAAVLVALVAIVAPFVVYAVPQVVGAEQSFVVLSGSMEPAMSPGDVVVVSDHNSGVGLAGALATVGLVDGPGSDIERGDVVTFRTSGSEPPTTHRVVEVVETETGEAYRTKGDANEDPDQSLVRPQQIVGEVVFVLPYVGFVVRFADTTAGFAALVVAPFGLLALSELYAVFSASDSADGNTGASDNGGDGDGGTGGDGDGGTGGDGDGADGGGTDGRGGDGGVPSTAGGSGGRGAGSPAVANVDDRDDGVRLRGDGTHPDLDSPSDGGATAVGTTDAEDDAGSETTYSFSRGELRLALVILAVAAPYAGFVAYSVTEAWSITAAAAVTLSLAFVAIAYRQAGRSGDRSSASAPVGATPVVPARRPEGDDRERVPVDSVESLVDLAAEGGDWLFADGDGYFILRDGAVYVHDVSSGGTTAVTESTNDPDNASGDEERESQ
jgi:signal peptidase I